MLNMEKKKEKNKNPMEIKAKVLLRVLVLDNWWNLGLTFDLSMWIRWGSPIQVVKLDDGHGEGDGHKRDDQVLHI